MTRVLLYTDLAPGETKTLRLHRRARTQQESPPTETPRSSTLIRHGDAAIDFEQDQLTLGQTTFPLPQLIVLPDSTDTWSHGVDRFNAPPQTSVFWHDAVLVEEGPVVHSILRHGAIGRSTLLADWRVYANLPCVELRLRVEWAEPHAIMKLAIPLPGITHHTDGIPGGSLRREPDGAERPFRDFTLAYTPSTSLGIVSPDTYALDVTPNAIRLTLLRNPLMAHHDPELHTAPHAHARHSDTGVHDFLFRFYTNTTPADLDRIATALQRPLLVVDTTAGMKPL